MSLPQAAPNSSLIVAHEVRKTFEIQTHGASSLKEMVLQGFAHVGKSVTHVAVDGISFELPAGRSLAIVGSNGSGKSTLLKMISGISRPDSGTLEVRGRVAALLELGAGFHPELTGMENIFLQGSILGLSRPEILAILDDVLEFCGLGEFIHTPLKRYSSGMTVRLGFALAVHCEADILLIDEVLAVGDYAFQQRCIRKIAELRQEGRTIVLVSHSLDQVESTSDDILWLEQGKMLGFGPVEEILPQVQARATRHIVAERASEKGPNLVSALDARNASRMAQTGDAPQPWEGRARIERVRLFNSCGEETDLFRPGESATIEIEFEAFEELDILDVEIGIAGFFDLRVAWSGTEFVGLRLRNVRGRHLVRGEFAAIPFLPGMYGMTVGLLRDLAVPEVYDVQHQRYIIHVLGRVDAENAAVAPPPGRFEVPAALS